MDHGHDRGRIGAYTVFGTFILGASMPLGLERAIITQTLFTIMVLMASHGCSA